METMKMEDEFEPYYPRDKEDNKEYVEFFWSKIKGDKLNKRIINEALHQTINKVVDDYY